MPDFFSIYSAYVGLPRVVSWARAGESEGGAGDQEQPAAP